MATRKKPVVEEPKVETPEPIPVTIEVEPEKAEAKEEESKADAPKRRRPPRKKKPVKPSFAMTAKDLNPILVGAFGIASVKLGEHWAIDDAEATQVTEPLIKVLAKLDLLEKVSNVSDGAMLLIAAASITIPRILITQQILKAKAVERSHGISPRKPEIRDNKNGSGEPSGRTGEAKSDDGESIKAIVAESIVQSY